MLEVQYDLGATPSFCLLHFVQVITWLNTPSVSLSLSTEEPKLVQRKSNLILYIVNTCDFLSLVRVRACLCLCVCVLI